MPDITLQEIDADIDVTIKVNPNAVAPNRTRGEQHRALEKKIVRFLLQEIAKIPGGPGGTSADVKYDPAKTYTAGTWVLHNPTDTQDGYAALSIDAIGLGEDPLTASTKWLVFPLRDELLLGASDVEALDGLINTKFLSPANYPAIYADTQARLLSYLADFLKARYVATQAELIGDGADETGLDVSNATQYPEYFTIHYAPLRKDFELHRSGKAADGITADNVNYFNTVGLADGYWKVKVTGGVGDPYELPTASDTVLGGVKVGAGLGIDAGVLAVLGYANAGNIVFVSVSGNNLSAQRANALKPYATLNAALAASEASDAIYLLPGEHTVSGAVGVLGNRRLVIAEGASLLATEVYLQDNAAILGAGALQANVSLFGGTTTDVAVEGVTVYGRIFYNAFSLTSAINQKLRLKNVRVFGGSNYALHLMPRYGGFYARSIDVEMDGCYLQSTANHVIRLSDAVDAQDLSQNPSRSTLTIRNSRLFAVDVSKKAISAGADAQYYLAYNAKNTDFGGAVVNEWAAQMGDGFSVGTGDGEGGGPTDWADITGIPTPVTNLSGTNTGDETDASIITKLGYTPVNPTNLAVTRLPEQTTAPTVAADQIVLYSSDEEGRTIPRFKDANGFVISALPGLILIYNNTGSTLTPGQVAQVAAPSSSGRPQVSLAQKTSPVPAVGIVAESIANNTAGFIRVSGSITGLNTSAFADNDVLYKDANGGLTNVRPVAPFYAQMIAMVLRSHNTQGRIYVIPGPILNDDRSTNQNSYAIGDGQGGNKRIIANNADATKPELRFNDTANVWEYSNDGVAFMSIGQGNSTREIITQAAHGLTVGQVLRHNGTTWVTAQANIAPNSEALALVESVPDANTFVLVYAGRITLSGLTPGANYFLSAATAGAYTSTEPTDADTVSKPIFFAISATTAIVQIQRGSIN